MTTMEDYCEAIKETKLPSKPGPRSTSFCDEARFREFVTKNIDMRDLSQHMADFAQGAGVAQTLHRIRGSLQTGIPQKLGYGGNLFQNVLSMMAVKQGASMKWTVCMWSASQTSWFNKTTKPEGMWFM